VEAGDPIAVASGEQLRFSYYYTTFDQNLAKPIFRSTKPNFLIENNTDNIVEGGIYESLHSEELIMQEISKRQKKKRLKSSSH